MADPRTLQLVTVILQQDPSVPKDAAERAIAALHTELPDQWLSESEAASRLGISKAALHQWRNRGEHHRAGRFPFQVLHTVMDTYVYDPREIAQYIARRIAPPNTGEEITAA